MDGETDEKAGAKYGVLYEVLDTMLEAGTESRGLRRGWTQEGAMDELFQRKEGAFEKLCKERRKEGKGRYRRK